MVDHSYEQYMCIYMCVLLPSSATMIFSLELLLLQPRLATFAAMSGCPTDRPSDAVG